VKRGCVFISAGDKERFASYATEKLTSNYDVVVNYYGKDADKSSRLRESSSKFFSLKATKFVALKSVYDSEIRGKYEWVAVFDDDALFLSGYMDDLIFEGNRLNLDLVSGCQSGKISHGVHIKEGGDHHVRYVNFVEMNFPVFRNEALSRYMDVYDGKLFGWGNDWWYCSVLKTRTRMNAGIVERVCIENPHGHGEMDSFMDWTKREEQWKKAMLRLGLEEWDAKTIGYV